MATAYLKCTANFTVKDKEGEDTIKARCGQFNIEGIKVNLIEDKQSLGSVTFPIYKKDMVKGGVMEFIISDNQITINIDAIFKCSIRPNYIDNFLNPDFIWYFDNFLEDFIINNKSRVSIDGLKVESRLVKNRFTGDFTEDLNLLNISTKLTKAEF